jgi:hypothetical protein
MMDVFTRFKSRYIVLDYIWINILLGILLAIIVTVIGLPLNLGNPFWLLSLYFLTMFMLCLATFNRLQNHHFQLKHLLGSQAIGGLPWLLLLIVFYGFQSLMTGVSQLTFFFAHLVAPEWLETAIRSANAPFTLDTNSLPLKILFLGVLFFSVTIVAPISGALPQQFWCALSSLGQFTSTFIRSLLRSVLFLWLSFTSKLECCLYR